MREQGWYDKERVTILEGKWQDFVGTKMLEDMAFDAVYTDTFSEEYDGEAQKSFSPFSSPGIMAP
jgi:type IV protein arginine methyltransferase